MYTVEINEETGIDVDINFNDAHDYVVEKGIELNGAFSYLIEYFEEVISRWLKNNPSKVDNMDVLDDYRYYVTCETEEEAQNIEAWFEENMSHAQSIICDAIEEYEEDYGDLLGDYEEEDM